MSNYKAAEANAEGWMTKIEKLLTELEEASAAQLSGLYDEVLEEIHNAPLSVRVRDGWYTPGLTSDGPEEYKMLLSTGGPALRIRGKLDEHHVPVTAILEMTHWYLPWKVYGEASEEVLLRFVNTFWFGEQ